MNGAAAVGGAVLRAFGRGSDQGYTRPLPGNLSVHPRPRRHLAIGRLQPRTGAQARPPTAIPRRSARAGPTRIAGPFHGVTPNRQVLNQAENRQPPQPPKRIGWSAVPAPECSTHAPLPTSWPPPAIPSPHKEEHQLSHIPPPRRGIVTGRPSLPWLLAYHRPHYGSQAPFLLYSLALRWTLGL